MWVIIGLYFGINIALSLILWFLLGLSKSQVSGVGFFLVGILLILPLLIGLLLTFGMLLLLGPTYSLGEYTENFFKKIKV